MTVKKIGTGELRPLPNLGEIVPAEQLLSKVARTGFLASPPTGSSDRNLNLQAVHTQQLASAENNYHETVQPVQTRVQDLVAKANALQAQLNLTPVEFSEGIELLLRNFITIIRDLDFKVRKMLMAQFMLQALDQHVLSDYTNKHLGLTKYFDTRLKALDDHREQMVHRLVQLAEKADIINHTEAQGITQVLDKGAPKKLWGLVKGERFEDVRKHLEQLYLQQLQPQLLQTGALRQL